MNVKQLLELAELRAMTRSGEARKLRIRAGVAQAEVARAIGVSDGCLSRWESGTRQPRGAAALAYRRLLAGLSDQVNRGDDGEGENDGSPLA